MNAHMFSGLSDLVGVPTVVASLPNSALRDVTLVTLNWLQWEYLHHGNWKIVQIRIFFPWRAWRVAWLTIMPLVEPMITSYVSSKAVTSWWKYQLMKFWSNNTWCSLISYKLSKTYSSKHTAGCFCWDVCTVIKIAFALGISVKQMI